MVSVSTRPFALISSHAKPKELITFCRGVLPWYELLSSDGTFRFLSENGLEVKNVSEYTGVAPILEHRVVTLHHKIHGGLLAKPTLEHTLELDALAMRRIGLIYIDPYPMIDKICEVGSTPEDVRRETDIGGPAMLRSAAKGGDRVIICDPRDLARVLEWQVDGCPDRERFILEGELKAENLASQYANISHLYKDYLVNGTPYDWMFIQKSWHEDFG